MHATKVIDVPAMERVVGHGLRYYLSYSDTI